MENCLRICRVAVSSTYKKEKWKIALTLLGVILAVAVYATTRIGTEIAKGQARTGLNNISAFHLSGDNLPSLYKELLNSTTLGITPWIVKGDKVITDGLNLFYFCELSLKNDEPLALLKGGYISVGGLTVENEIQIGTCNFNSLSPLENNPVAIFDLSSDDLSEISTLSITGTREEVKNIINNLPSGTNSVESEATGSTAADHATRAMRLNLRVLAILSFVVAGLLVYNTISYLALLRKRDYSTLLAIGASPKSISNSLHLESITIAAIGAVLGTLIGELASELVFKDMMQNTVSLLYRLDSYSENKISYLVVFGESLLLAAITCLLASKIAAKEIKNQPPGVGMSYVRAEHTNAIPSGRLLLCALALLGLATITASPSLLEASTWLGFLSPLITLGAGACLSPCILKFVANSLLTRSKSTSCRTAANQILMTPARSSVAAVSLSLALGLSLAIGIFVNSFRGSVENWIFEIAKADLFISRTTSDEQPLLSRSTIQALKSNPHVIEYDTQSSQFVTYNDKKILLSSFDFNLAIKHQRMEVLSGEFTNNSEDVLISEPFHNIFGVEPGESINIAGYKLSVSAVVKDYTSNVGVVFFDNPKYKSIFPGAAEDSYSIYTDGTDIKTLFDEDNVLLQTKDELATAVLDIFDLVLSLTSVVQVAALSVAILSLFTSLSMIFIERKFELASLFAFGASTKQIRSTVIAEALILAIAGLLSGLIIGLLLGLVLVFSVNRHFFGWSVEFSFSETNFLFVTALTLITALACGALLARNVKPNSLIVATRYS